MTYAAQQLEVVFAETVLHEQGCFIDNHWVIARQQVDERCIMRFARKTGDPLRLINLTGQALEVLGLNNDLCASDDYTVSMQVAAALHDQVAEADGIIHVSRQINSRLAMALFERSLVHCEPNAVRLTAHRDYPGLLDTFNVELLPRGGASPA